MAARPPPRRAVCRAIPAATAAAVLAELQRRLVFARADGRAVRPQLVPVGGARRGSASLKDLDVLVVVPSLLALPGLLASGALRPPRPGDRAAVAETVSGGDRRRTLVLSWRTAARAKPVFFSVDLFAATAAEKAFALLHLTGPQAYNVRIRRHAKNRGWKLSQYGLFVRGTDTRVRGSAGIRTERALAKFLGVTFRLPADR